MIIRLIEPSKSLEICESYPSVWKLSLNGMVEEVFINLSPKSFLKSTTSKVTILIKFSKRIITFAGSVTLFIGKWAINCKELIVAQHY